MFILADSIVLRVLVRSYAFVALQFILLMWTVGFNSMLITYTYTHKWKTNSVVGLTHVDVN